MISDPITLEKIDELLKFLPSFAATGTRFVKCWAGCDETEDGAITVPYPIYTDEVLEFFQLAGQSCWSDYGYDPREAGAMLKDEAFIERAGLEEIKSMLTYCVRGERFCDGHWQAILESGSVTAILRRLAVLKASLKEL